jgi:hypothetical protein
MTSYSVYPAFEIFYNTVGQLVDASAELALLSWLASEAGGPTTDLIVISHGWNNDIPEARKLYTDFFTAMQSVQSSQHVATDRNFAVAGVFWPSKRFALPGDISGGAAAVAPSDAEQLNDQLDQLKLALADDPAAATKIELARKQIPVLEQSLAAQDAFVAALMSALPAPGANPDEGMDTSIASAKSGAVPGNVVLSRIAAPMFPDLSISADEGGGHALGLGDWVGNITSAASSLANLTTYYTMKERAGTVGTSGVLQTILKIQAARTGLRLHLIGHSFGGRLVTAAASALTEPNTIASMLLLEAAYSHYGVAVDWDGEGHNGSFRRLVAAPQVKGNILITHSVNDTAVGLAYPLASSILGQVAANVVTDLASEVIGGPNDKFGGMGRNGAQKTPEAFDDTLQPVGTRYTPLPAGKTIRNLNGDGPLPLPTIQNHGDVAKPEIVWAWLSSLG